MNCTWTEKISLMIDGELPAAEVREVERHLTECVECRQSRADFLVFRNQIASYVPSVQPLASSGVLATILAEKVIQARENNKPPATSRFVFGMSFNPRLAVFAALTLVALLITLVVYRISQRQELPQRQAAVPRVTPVPFGSQQKQSEQQTVAQTLDLNERAPAHSIKKTNVTRRKRNVELPVPVQLATVPSQSPVAPDTTSPPVRSADTQTMTAMHFEKSELLLRSFRNIRLAEPGVTAEVGYEKRRAQQLVYQNMMLRREADAAGDVQSASLLENLEPILIDIANLPDEPEDEDIRVIKDRVERKNIVALLQVNSTALARALD